MFYFVASDSAIVAEVSIAMPSKSVMQAPVRVGSQKFQVQVETFTAFLSSL